MSFSASMRRFNTLAARTRQDAWPLTVTLSTDTASTAIKCAGSPPTRRRVQDDSRAGWVERVTRTFAFTRAQIPSTATVALKARFTITVDALNPGNVATVWQIFDLTDSNGGSELRAAAFRIDS